ncbi:MAG: argininosuccinate lyase, partial [Desulfatiglandales bacterium]
NDQVALDLRLYLKTRSLEILQALKALMETLVNKAEDYWGHVMPGYTHLQRAQPVLISQHLMAYYFMFRRDQERFIGALERISRNPLGSGALSGSGLPIDRHMVSEALDMGPPTPNSMDGVSDRDFAIEFLSNSAICMMHLSRLSEELVIWSTREFSFVELKDAFCTGSSLMPQKKNPDVPELVRGKTGRVYGNLIALLVTMKGLPLTYNKDMQEDKEPIFDTYNTLIQSLRVMQLLIAGLRFNLDRLKEAIKEGNLTATDLVEYLVLKGMSFREAHETVGRLVLLALEEGKELYQLKLERLRALSPLIGEDVYEWLDPMKSVQKKLSYGGTAPERVMEQIRVAKEELLRC